MTTTTPQLPPAARATNVPDYSAPRAGDGATGFITQTKALFVDAYRELNSKKLFWIVLALSVIVVAAFAIPGINERGVTLFKLEFPGAWNTSLLSKGEFYKLMYTLFAIPIWLAWAATILALVSTSSIFPDMLTGGSIDLYLAKPIGRLRLFLTKYVTGLTFVFLQVTLFSLAAFLLIGIRGGSWEPGLFLAVPIMVVFFSYLFCVSALLGVMTRSTIAAMLLTLLIWFFFWAAHASETTIRMFRIRSEIQQERYTSVIDRNNADIAKFQAQIAIAPGATTTSAEPSSDAAPTTQPTTQPASQPTTGVAGLIRNIEFQRNATIKSKEDDAKTMRKLQLAHRIARGVTACLPKTTQTIDLLRRSLVESAKLPGNFDDDEGNGNGGGNHRRRQRSDPAEVEVDDREVQQRLRRDVDSDSPAYIIGTSLGFEAVMLVLAAWVFCRRDY